MALLQWLKDGCPPLLFFGFIFLLIIIKLLSNKNLRKSKSKLPPSPPKLPILGNLHQLGTMPHLSLHKLAKKFGPIMSLQLGEIPTVVISSARLAKEAMTSHDLALSSRPVLYSAKYLFYDCTDIVFAPYGDYWRYIRKICILDLLSAKRVQSYAPVRVQQVARLVDRVAESYPGSTDLTKMLGLYANDVLCQVVFGRDFSEGGDYHRYGFQDMLNDYQELLGGFSVGDFFPSFNFIHSLTGMKSRLEDTYRRFDKLFDQIITEHQNTHEETNRDKDLLDVLLGMQKEGSVEMPLTMDNVKAISLDMFAAGTDTTFITLDWTMTELLTNPQVMKRAQDEVRSIVGERKFVSESDLPQLHYMKAVVKEIFRLHPPVPVLVPRESIQGIVIDGYEIPQKTRFFVNVWSIGRDSETWENPETFEPERFLGNNIDFKGQDFKLIPFGAGRRGCPAITFATAAIELPLAQLLHGFDWELPRGVAAKDLDMTEVFGISMHRKEHLLVVTRPRFSY
uniref:Cytochrome P450 CYP71AP39 n=1 Tax=Polygala tenuifolia TaxID=355332 RepID=A0A1Z2WUY7_9FABA|nr:cytochrome P450 CYP71AP39 [Polygala tenuifolia]